MTLSATAGQTNSLSYKTGILRAANINTEITVARQGFAHRDQGFELDY